MRKVQFVVSDDWVVWEMDPHCKLCLRHKSRPLCFFSWQLLPAQELSVRTSFNTSSRVFHMTNSLYHDKMPERVTLERGELYLGSQFQSFSLLSCDGHMANDLLPSVRSHFLDSLPSPLQLGSSGGHPRFQSITLSPAFSVPPSFEVFSLL